MTFFINLCAELKKLRNYHILQAILSGLGMYDVTRCTKLWADLKPELLQTYQSLNQEMNPVGNYKQYRNLIQMNAEQNLSYLPCVSVISRDLIIMKEGNLDHGTGGSINYEKCKMIGKEMESLSKLQAKAAVFVLSHPSIEILSYFHLLQPFPTEILHELAKSYISCSNKLFFTFGGSMGRISRKPITRKKIPSMLSSDQVTAIKGPERVVKTRSAIDYSFKKCQD